MKKILSAVLALAMAASMTTVAFAEGDAPKVTTGNTKSEVTQGEVAPEEDKDITFQVVQHVDITATSAPTADGTGTGATNIGKYTVSPMAGINKNYSTVITGTETLVDVTSANVKQGTAKWVGVLITTDKELTDLAVKTPSMTEYANLVQSDIDEAKSGGATGRKTFVWWLKSENIPTDGEDIYIKEKDKSDDSAIKLNVKFKAFDESTDTTSNTSYTSNSHNKTTTTAKIADIAKDLSDGDNLTIKLATDNKTVTGDVLKEIKGKDVDVKVEVADGIEWSFNGEDIPENWDTKDINFNLDTEKSEVPADTLNDFTTGKKSKTLSLDYDGAFGFTMQLSVHIGYLNDGQYANIYYYNPETKALEFKESSEINSAGNAKFDFKHASDYVILVADKAATASDTVDTTDDTSDNTDSTKDTNESNPVTGNTMPVALVITSLATVALITKKKLAK